MSNLELARARQALHDTREQYRLLALELSLVPVDSARWFPLFDDLQALSATVMDRESKVDTLACDELFRSCRLVLR